MKNVKNSSKLNFSQSIEREIQRYLKVYKSSSSITHLYGNIINEVEKSLITLTLNFANGNKSKASKILGINRNTLHKKICLLKIKK